MGLQAKPGAGWDWLRPGGRGGRVQAGPPLPPSLPGLDGWLVLTSA